jgi:hypothetical protein
MEMSGQLLAPATLLRWAVPLVRLDRRLNFACDRFMNEISAKHKISYTKRAEFMLHCI